jgi:hypothetical protein
LFHFNERGECQIVPGNNNQFLFPKMWSCHTLSPFMRNVKKFLFYRRHDQPAAAACYAKNAMKDWVLHLITWTISAIKMPSKPTNKRTNIQTNEGEEPLDTDLTLLWLQLKYVYFPCLALMRRNYVVCAHILDKIKNFGQLKIVCCLTNA